MNQITQIWCQNGPVLTLYAVKCIRNAFLSIICNTYGAKTYFNTIWCQNVLVSAVKCNRNAFLTICMILRPYGAGIRFWGTIYAPNDSNNSNHAIWCQMYPF